MRTHLAPSHRRLVPVIALALALAGAALAGATVQTYFVSGTVTFSSPFDPLPVGTPWSGFYTFDDATPEDDPDPPGDDNANLGVYFTGSFFLDFGPAIGSITFDQSAFITVINNGVGFCSTADTFTLFADEGARNTPAFTNPINIANILFRDSSLSAPCVAEPAPTTLVDDDLIDVPHVLGPPWDADDQVISLNVSASGGGCPPFTSNCFATLTIEQLAPAANLTVTKSGAGSGLVTSSPVGIDCGATCTALMGGMVDLTATPDPGSVFVAWTGCDSVLGNVCTVDMSGGDRTVDAQFEGFSILPIPTLSPAGIALLATALLGAGFLALSRRRRSA